MESEAPNNLSETIFGLLEKKPMSLEELVLATGESEADCKEAIFALLSAVQITFSKDWKKLRTYGNDFVIA